MGATQVADGTNDESGGIPLALDVLRLLSGYFIELLGHPLDLIGVDGAPTPHCLTRNVVTGRLQVFFLGHRTVTRDSLVVPPFGLPATVIRPLSEVPWPTLA